MLYNISFWGTQNDPGVDLSGFYEIFILGHKYDVGKYVYYECILNRCSIKLFMF